MQNVTCRRQGWWRDRGRACEGSGLGVDVVLVCRKITSPQKVFPVPVLSLIAPFRDRAFPSVPGSPLPLSWSHLSVSSGTLLGHVLHSATSCPPHLPTPTFDLRCFPTWRISTLLEAAEPFLALEPSAIHRGLIPLWPLFLCGQVLLSRGRPFLTVWCEIFQGSNAYLKIYLCIL